MSARAAIAELATPHGRAVVVELADDTALAEARAAIDPAELAAAERLPPARARDLVAGRFALRAALGDDGVACAPIGTDDRGAPVLPEGYVGSISHKHAFAAGLVARADTLIGARIGVDLERRAGLRVDIARRILTAAELAKLPTEPAAREAAVLRAFSIKEAIYKAIDPFMRRYVGFQEVELAFVGEQIRVATALPVMIEASVTVCGEHWLATARARGARASTF